ncbi:hypothetical protein M422DRAFT_191951 [Sphaerobolus stellatus SS14]|uniref:HAT C-terminal dimerisation domain-containing protein n=1 Tax=Sphaerobolus stellatus (strain SS14) TaxID=990650 RepID=A0A0C9UMB3_SPHS4|nr:hypothetical protein M422DRAFT_191951 [Sphaerobolus stellatus SS14]
MVAGIAQDYLVIQGSSLPCECCFSSSGLTGTDHCNQLLLKTLEMLQILKNAYRSGALKTIVEILADDESIAAQEQAEDDILV